jgi:hypothetical protein
MKNKVKQTLISNGVFTQEEFEQHEDKIKGTFLYKKTELELALSDALILCKDTFLKKA